MSKILDNDKTEKHESYGMINVSRFTGGSQIYFGSSIKHSGGIKISIHEADVTRRLSNDWYHPERSPLIEVWLSYNQFAEMLTTGMNTTGTPCTIKSFNGKKKEQPPFTSKRLQFEDEFKHEMIKIATKFESLENFAKTLESKSSVSKKEKTELLREIQQVKQEINSNIPFIQTQFNEQMDKTVVEAKSEMEGFMETKIRDLGIKALPDSLKIGIDS